MSVTPAQSHETPPYHPRPVRMWKVFLPVTLAALGLIIFLAAVIVLAFPYEVEQAQQLSIISSLMLMCFILVPMLICSLVVVLALGAAVFGVGALHEFTEDKLQQAQELSHTASDKAISATSSVSRRSIGFNARFAILDRLTRPENSSANRGERD